MASRDSDAAERLAATFGLSGWQVVETRRNPWGRVPITAGGADLDGGSRAYMDRLMASTMRPEPQSRRHHYVPRTYLKRWSFDGRRVWNLDTVTGAVRPLSVNDVCVEEDFYRVVGPNGEAHNRVEAMFSIVDVELRRIQTLFEGLDDADALEFDDLIGLGVTIAVQRMRTAQQRRLLLQRDAWLVAQSPDQFKSIASRSNRLAIAGVHTELLFASMWDAADVMTTRSIEVWDDPDGRFWTCDAPVLVPFRKNKGPNLLAAPQIFWPVSPHRVVVLTNRPTGEKAIIRPATAKERGQVRTVVEQGRDRWIFATAEQADALPASKKFRRRRQLRLRCSPLTPQNQFIEPPGCCVEHGDGFSAVPDVVLCNQGLHIEAAAMRDYA